MRTVAEQGWRGIANGKLLWLAAAEFDVFITVDRLAEVTDHDLIVIPLCESGEPFNCQ